MDTLLDRRRRIVARLATRSVAPLILLAGLAFPHIASVPTRAFQADAPDAELLLPLHNDSLSRGLSVSQYRLPPGERSAYRRAFAALDQGDWAGAEAIAATIKDKRLVGHVLAGRYLSHDGNASFSQLRQWLDLYADLPEADAVFRLAQVARPVGTTATLPQPRHADLHDPSSDTDIILAEPRTNAGDRASERYYAGDHTGALAQATRAVESLGKRASTSHWIAGLAAWQLGKYPDAATHFTALSQAHTASNWMVAAGAYWAGRVEERRGAPQAAAQWFVKASRYRTTFYGMLAMQKLGIDIAHEISGEAMTAGHLDTLAEDPAGYRAIALLELGRKDLAAQELEQVDPADPRMVEALLVVADAAHLGEQSFDLAQRLAPADGPTSISTQFPIPKWKPHGGFRIDPALVYAVARQESMFDPKAVSAKGAQGLMQIMPRTAEAVVGGNLRENALFDPATNLDLGQRYITTLMGDPSIGENLLLLAAAYNTGTGNLAKFRRSIQMTDPLLAIESVPTGETRQFIERVLANYWIYSARMGRNSDTLTDLANGRWPTYRWEDASAATPRSPISTAAAE